MHFEDVTSKQEERKIESEVHTPNETLMFMEKTFLYYTTII
tara:strand:+ start:2353 stop:2475 length:123 start_codon:yes stop_codon:yes gene_type:complete